MAEILAIGVSHYPPLCRRDDRMADILKRMLRNPDLPEQLRTPRGWPSAMQAEWGHDEGVASAAGHRAALLEWMRRVTGRARCV